MNLLARANEQANIWVKDMMLELRTDDPRLALHALRAGLQALRDRLTVEEAAQLSAQLPLFVRGMFFEGWDPTDKPLRIRNRDEFLRLVRAKYAPRDDAAADDIVLALFRVLSRHVASGELTDIVMSLPRKLLDLVDAGRGAEARIGTE